MAVVALQQIEAEARKQGQPLLDDLQDTMDGLQGATEMRGTGERHIRLLPTKPIFEVSPSRARPKAARVPDSFPCVCSLYSESLLARAPWNACTASSAAMQSKGGREAFCITAAESHSPDTPLLEERGLAL